MEIPHSLQGHPLSGKQWMKMTDENSIDDSGFSTTAHSRCIACKRTDLKGVILILQQVDDFLIGTTGQATAERITQKIGEKVKF